MMSLFGHSLSALSPWLLASLPVALGLLVYVYRKRGTSGRTIVSALFLFERLPRMNPARRKFVPPPRFWLELAIFCLLAFAAAGLIATKPGKHIALVIDTSLSMGARDSSGQTRLAVAKTALLGDLPTYSTGADSFSLYSLNSSLKRVSEPGTDGAHIKAALGELDLSYAVDRVSTLVSSLLSDPQFDAVWLYTDRKPAPDGEVESNLRFVSIATPESTRGLVNAWISGASYGQIGDTSSVTVITDVAGVEVTNGTLSLECRTPTGVVLPRMTRPVTLRGASPVSTTFSDVNSAWVDCSVAISIRSEDALPADDTAWLVRGSAGAPVQVMGPLDPQALGLAPLPTLRFERAEGSEERNDVRALYHRTTPKEMPTAPTLLVYPAPGQLPWGGSVRASTNPEGKISRWLESHPITLYLQLGLLTIPNPRIIDCPESSTPILYTTEGAVGCAGERAGVRYVIFGFELFPFDGLRNPSLSILTLNTFKWLFQGASSATGTRTNESVSAPPDAVDATYLLPVIAPLKLSPAGVITPEKPGVISFRNSKGATIASSAVNFFSAQESNITLDAPADITSLETQKAARPDRTLHVYLWLALGAFTILALDLLVRLIRSLPRGRA